MPDHLYPTVAGLKLEVPFMVAAGVVKTLEQAKQVAKGLSAAVVLGSITVEPRLGNQGRVFYPDAPAAFSINSLGLPNGGLPYYRRNTKDIVDTAHASGKPCIVSLAGFSSGDYQTLGCHADVAGADAIEINLGCPNVWTDGTQHRIASFDLDYISQILNALVVVRPPLIVKLSPYSDPSIIPDVAALLNSNSQVCGVTLCNTFPNGFAYDDTTSPAIEFGTGLGGVAGPALRPIVLGQIKQFRQHLDANIDIIAVGGVEDASHVLEYQRAGAAAVQVATAYWWRGEHALETIANGLAFPTVQEDAHAQ